MKRSLLLLCLWIGTFAGGHALGTSTAPIEHDQYYFCAATNDSCEGWVYILGYGIFNCCCSLNQGQDWYVCWGFLNYYRNADSTLICYELLGGWNMTEVECEPAPVAPSPIGPLEPNAECGCSLMSR